MSPVSRSPFAPGQKLNATKKVETGCLCVMKRVDRRKLKQRSDAAEGGDSQLPKRRANKSTESRLTQTSTWTHISRQTGDRRLKVLQHTAHNNFECYLADRDGAIES